MDDNQIIELYLTRSENAISETITKYGRYCHTIAFNILHNSEDSEECVNDTYMKAWEIIPPQRPKRLAVFLGKITRNLSLNRYNLYTAGKRGYGQVSLALDELSECILASDNVEHVADDLMLTDTLNNFLASLPEEARKIFMRRYWYFSPVKEIAYDFGISESKVKMSLLRARARLKELLQKEGIEL